MCFHSSRHDCDEAFSWLPAAVRDLNTAGVVHIALNSGRSREAGAATRAKVETGWSHIHGFAELHAEPLVDDLGNPIAAPGCAGFAPNGAC